MSNIRNYIDHTLSLDPTKPEGVSQSTKAMLADLYKLRAPLWTIVGGAHATGVSRLLEELARMRGTGAGSQETLRVVLPDEDSQPIAIGRGATQQRLELLKALRRELEAISPSIRRESRHQIRKATVRDPSCESLFGEVKNFLNHLPICRIIVDNGHYLRQDTPAVQRLFQLQRVVDHPFVMIFGVRLSKEHPTTEKIFKHVLEDVLGAKDTLDPPKTLYPLAESQLIDPILMELLAGQYALPTDELIRKAPEYTEDLKKAVARNWVRLDVLAMRVDEKLRARDPRPRSPDRPGSLTYQMLREILDKMLGK
jgi:hypothetical protein